MAEAASADSSTAGNDRHSGRLPIEGGRFDRLRRAIGWPILLREMRADFRKNRFLLTHTLCLALLATVVLVLVATQIEDQGTTPTRIGQSLFGIFFIVQYLVILLVFPGFSATTFAEERGRHTLDLLLTTTMRPPELVFGKFLASSMYCVLYVIASIPLMAVAFLFGGITPDEVAMAYVLLIAFTLLISMLGVCVSSCLGTSLRASLTMYCLVFLILVASASYFESTPARLNGDPPIVRHLLESMGWGGDGFVATTTYLSALLVAIFAYLFVITTNRIRPSADNKATALRLLTVVAVTVIAGGLAAARGDEPESVLLPIGFMLFLIALVFPTEDVEVSRRNRRTFTRWTGVRFPFRILAPGAFWGFLFSVVSVFLVYFVVTGVWRWNGLDDTEQTSTVDYLLAMPLYFSAIAAGGFCLASFEYSPLYARLTLLFSFVITLLLPVIFALSEQADAVWTMYYLSPITLWWSLHPDPHDDSGITYELWGIPDIEVAQYVFVSAAIVFALIGVTKCRRSGYPLFSFALPRGRDGCDRRLRVGVHGCHAYELIPGRDNVPFLDVEFDESSVDR